jgi:diguanylate cyclase (GGDEF)-like protein
MASIVSKRSSLQQRDNQAGSYPIAKTIQHELVADTQHKLAALLQTTIEIEPLFELFYGQVKSLLKLDSCQFVNQTKDIKLKLGTICAHNCDYSLNIQQQYLGNISFTRKHRFSEAELAQLEKLLSTLVYPLRNTINYRDALNQALSDPLTGLGNRVALDNSLEYQWQMAQRYEQDLGVLMIDIDFFKKINDTYGHDIGDYVIKHVAESIKATTRQTDMVFRYGGEEFLVLLNKTTTLGSSIIAERIRENIENLKLVGAKGQLIKVTASVGGTHLKAGISKKKLVQEADKALYAAKKQGRNCVSFYQAETVSTHTGRLTV